MKKVEQVQFANCFHLVIERWRSQYWCVKNPIKNDFFNFFNGLQIISGFLWKRMKKFSRKIKHNTTFRKQKTENRNERRLSDTFPCFIAESTVWMTHTFRKWMTWNNWWKWNSQLNVNHQFRCCRVLLWSTLSNFELKWIFIYFMVVKRYWHK